MGQTDRQTDRQTSVDNVVCALRNITLYQVTLTCKYILQYWNINY